jgi:hypothetical protein
VDFDEAAYARKLERWAISDLPMFRIEDWQGTWGGATSGVLSSRSTLDGSTRRSVTMARTVWHHRPGSSIEIRLVSSRPSVDEEGRRDSALTNMAIQLVKGQLAEGAAAEDHNREVLELTERLRSGEYPWTTRILVVEGIAIEFDVLAVGEVWAAFGDLDEDVSIDMQGHGVRFAAFQLLAIIDSDAGVAEEDTRWSQRAECFLMRHGRWVPSFLHGWPTWFGNRKASGLRGLPGDLAYLRDSLFRRADHGEPPPWFSDQPGDGPDGGSPVPAHPRESPPTGTIGAEAHPDSN